MTRRARIDRNARWLFAAGIVAASALAIRLLHLFFTERLNPLASSLQLDSATYDAWARALAFGGDAGPTTLMQSPVYPWLLSALYRIFGPVPAAARALQAALGTASVVLIALVTRRLFSSTAAALVAGAIAALYAPLIFFEGLILPATLIVFLNTLAVAAFVLPRRPGPAAMLAGGIVLGAAIAANPPTLLLLPFVLLHVRLGGAGRPRLARGALPIVMGVSLALAPLVIRNYLRAGEFIPLTTGGGINFYIGNNAGANGYYAPPSYRGKSLGRSPEEQWRLMTEIARDDSGRALGESGVSRFWFAAGLRWGRDHPAKWSALAWQKFLFFWNRHERANVESFYFHRRFPGVLRLPLLTFGIVAPLALLGMFLSRDRARGLWLLYGGALAYLATAVAFYVTARYRLPAIPFLIPFAAAAVTGLASLARRRSLAELALLAAALGALVIFTNFTVARDTPQGLSANLVRAGDAYLSRGDTLRAGAAYLEALAQDDRSEGAKRGLSRIGPGLEP